MRLGRRLSTGIAEDPPAPTAEPARPATVEHTTIEVPADREVRREYAEQAAQR